MQEHETMPYLRETLLFLSLAGLLIPLLQRLRINQVLGFLVAGTCVGPFGLGAFADQMPFVALFSFRDVETVAPAANVGLLLLMFMIGLELSTERLWALRYRVFVAGGAQVALCAAIIGALAWLFGNPKEIALVLGLVLALSSTAVVMQLLSERRTLGTTLGQASFSILMLQDLAIVPILILVDVLADGKSGDLVSLIGIAFLKAAAVIAFLYLFGRRVIRPVFRYFVRGHQPDVFIALTLLSLLGIAGVTAAAGLSMALGALLAGLLISETEFRHEVTVTIEPFRGLLMGLFFMSIGMQVNVLEIFRYPLLLPLSVIGLYLTKAIVISLILRIGGLQWGRAAEGGLLLGQGGEFAFIVVGYAVSVQLLSPPVSQFMLLVVGLSLFVTPAASRLGAAIGAWSEGRNAVYQSGRSGNQTAQPAKGHVIIAGFGRVGRLLADVLTGYDIRYVALDTNADLVAKNSNFGAPVYFGNAARVDLLDKVNAGEARAIVLTMDDPASALAAVRSIRQRYPLVPLYARSRDEAHSHTLEAAGANAVVPEALEASLQLSALVLQTFNVDAGAARMYLQAARSRRQVVAD